MDDLTPTTKPKTKTTNAAYKARMAAAAAEIVARREPLRRQASGLRAIIAAGPVCGVPGFGYKAIARYRRKLAEIEQKIQALDPDVMAFLGEDFNDISMKRQLERQEFLIVAAEQWEIDNPLPRIN